MARTLRERLLAKATSNGAAECWEWTAYRSTQGYGMIHDRGKPRGAHRVSFELHCGPIPDGMDVCHSCDNRGCINPDHLFVGTRADNLADMVAKGRQTRGEANPSAKLTETDVIAILRAADGRPSSLARQYGVSPSLICDIRAGRAWDYLRERT